jgi:hypothetical protein
MASCESFVTAQAVSIAVDKGTENYVLSVYWTPHQAESGCLDRILIDRNLETLTTEGRTVFRSR